MKVSLSILLAVSSVAVANPAARVSNMKILKEHYYIHISYYVLMFYNIYINRMMFAKFAHKKLEFYGETLELNIMKR